MMKTKADKKEYARQYRLKNKAKIALKARNYQLKNPEKVRANSKRHRENNVEYYKEYGKRYRETHREYFRLVSKKYREDNLEFVRRYAMDWRAKNYSRYKKAHEYGSKIWAKKNPEKVSAYIKVNRALKSGELVKGSCRDCGSEMVHAHHFDYSKPLSVIWLCPLHHSAEHKRINEQAKK